MAAYGAGSHYRRQFCTHHYLRASGLRYVDIDKAVGADEDTGEWYSDMLDTDGVHPTKAGAMAMFDAVMDVIPELARE